MNNKLENIGYVVKKKYRLPSEKISIIKFKNIDISLWWNIKKQNQFKLASFLQVAQWSCYCTSTEEIKL